MSNGPRAHTPRPTHTVLRRRLVSQLITSAEVVLVLLSFSLAVGMAGYHWLGPMSWIDAFVNAAMLLGGMGPVNAPVTPGGKLFAGCFALYAGLVFLVVAALLLAPAVHRLLHRYHWEGKDQ